MEVPIVSDSSDGGTESCVGLEPLYGMVFETEKVLRDFYNDYARSQGFGIVETSMKSNLDGKKKYFQYSCSRQGKYVCSSSNQFSARRAMKTGCKARINVIQELNGKFHISKVCHSHNHYLNPKDYRYFTSHKKIDSFSKWCLEVNHDVGIRPGKCFVSVVVRSGGSFEDVPFDERACRNYIAKYRKSKLGEGDAEVVMQYFKRMHVRNPNFFHVVDVDHEELLRNLLWVDARSRAAYESFSDVITFDTTYLTNVYRMPFAPFVGVNHHGQSVLLGCGLLSCETTESYVWLFRNWLECMGKAPNAIITDQCMAIGNAVAEVFPSSRHHLCLWHILRKVPQKYGSMERYHEFFFSLKNVVYDSLTVTEFEGRWDHMLDEFKQQDDEWLASLYDLLEKWVPVFLRNSFWAGMSTTQRSESINSFFDSYVDSSTPLKKFVKKYEFAMKSRVEAENKVDFKSRTVVNEPFTKYKFECQFRDAYTSEIYLRFQSELRDMVNCNVKSLGSDGFVSTYDVSDLIHFEDGAHRKMVFKVFFCDSGFDPVCLCRLYEFKGVLCRHIVKVMIEKEIYEVPEEFILVRWRKGINRKHNLVNNCYDNFGTPEQRVRQDKLYMQFSHVCDIAVTNKELFDLTQVYLGSFSEMLLAKADELSDAVNPAKGADKQVLSPLKVKSKGRPTYKRKESVAFSGKRGKATTKKPVKKPKACKAICTAS